MKETCSMCPYYYRVELTPGQWTHFCQRGVETKMIAKTDTRCMVDMPEWCLRQYVTEAAT